MSKNQLKIYNGPMTLPEVNSEDRDSTTLFVTFTDFDRRVIVDKFPEARVFSVCYQRDNKNAEWSEFNKQHAVVTGLEPWDEEDPEILEAQNAIIIESKSVVRSSKGQKAIEALSDYLETFVGSVVSKSVGSAKPLSKILKDDPEGDLLYSQVVGLTRASDGYTGRVRTAMGDDPVAIANAISEAVEVNSGEVLFEIADQNLGTIGYDSVEDVFTIHPHEVETFTNQLAEWVEYRNGDSVHTYMPKQYVVGYMKAPIHPGVKPLESISPAPVMGKSLVPRFHAGYDEDTKTYVTEPMDDLGEFITDVTQKDAQEAAERLLEWFENVDFEYESSKADALAFALTPFLIRYMPEAPIPGLMTMADRPKSGKTELARMIAKMSGTDVDEQAFPKDSEMSNTLASILNSSTKISLFDNIKDSIDSGPLESILTSRSLTVRKFHTQKNMKIKNNTVWMFTYNDPSVSEDMARRLVIIPMSKKPDKSKQWDTTTLTRLTEARSSVMIDLLTLIMNWKAQGENWGSATYSGFDQWAGVLSGILEAAGVEGFLASRDDTQSKIDTGSGEKAEMLLRILKIMGVETRWTLSDLQDAVELGEMEKLDLRSRDFSAVTEDDKSENDRMRDTILHKKAVAGYLKHGKGGNRSQGMILKSLTRDDISPVLKLNQTTGSAGVKYYQLEVKPGLSLAELLLVSQD